MTTKPQTILPLPDPPEREPDDMTSVQHLGENGNLHHLAQYLGNPNTTIVSGERFIIPTPGTPANQRTAPDMLIAFNANPALYRQDNSYVISRQGKPPDLVMEIASRRTGEIGARDKPARYAALGISEYWRFDETDDFHGTRLAGHRLAGGQYEPISIEEVKDGIVQGYSTVLNLFIRWERGSSAGTTPRRGRKYPPSSRSGRAGWRPRPELGTWRRNWHRDKRRDKQQGARLPAGNSATPTRPPAPETFLPTNLVPVLVGLTCKSQQPENLTQM